MLIRLWHLPGICWRNTLGYLQARSSSLSLFFKVLARKYHAVATPGGQYRSLVLAWGRKKVVLGERNLLDVFGTICCLHLQVVLWSLYHVYGNLTYPLLSQLMMLDAAQNRMLQLQLFMPKWTLPPLPWNGRLWRSFLCKKIKVFLQLAAAPLCSSPYKCHLFSIGPKPMCTSSCSTVTDIEFGMKTSKFESTRTQNQLVLKLLLLCVVSRFFWYFSSTIGH